jgi:hypothetical protein
VIRFFEHVIPMLERSERGGTLRLVDAPMLHARDEMMFPSSGSKQQTGVRFDTAK